MDNATSLELHHRVLDTLRSSGSLDIVVGDVSVLDEGESKDEVADAPTKTVVKATTGKPWAVLFVSNGVNPSLVERSVRRAGEAKRLLGPDLGSAILSPLAEGVFEGLSYALWPFHSELSSHRAVVLVQRKRLQAPVLSWLRGVAERTRRVVSGEQVHDRYVAPLESIWTDQRLPEEMRNRARTGLDRLHAGVWQPVTVVEHNDFGVWNVLLWQRGSAHPSGSCPFIVIDWSGANLEGYPFSDLITFSSSVHLPKRHLGKEVLSLCRILECELVDAMSYVLASLGFLGMNLEYFPEDRYQLVCRRMFGMLVQALRATGS